jgi:hypothetical protein
VQSYVIDVDSNSTQTLHISGNIHYWNRANLKLRCNSGKGYVTLRFCCKDCILMHYQSVVLFSLAPLKTSVYVTNYMNECDNTCIYFYLCLALCV